MGKIMSERPKLVLANGKPTAVVLSLRDYEELLKCAEDFEDLEELRRLRKKTLQFRGFEEFLRELG